MNTVVVTNMSGIRLTVLNKHIKSLRETLKDQEFSFELPADADRFALAINGMNQLGLSAIYAGPEICEEHTKPAAEAMTTDTQPTSLPTEAELKAKTVKELKAICKALGLKNYSPLNEGELVALIITNQSK